MQQRRASARRGKESCFAFILGHELRRKALKKVTGMHTGAANGNESRNKVQSSFSLKKSKF
jgi:hypothetical protein